ncbi:hypothetical protein ACP70R_031361 [Stipagrostis hirtigluma subsp. patula]
MARLLLCLALLLVAAAAGPAAGGEPGGGGGLSRDDFPEGFVFGAATSAYQWEGAAAEDGRAPSVWDTFAHAGHYPGNGDVAADGYHKYKDDVKLMEETGLDAYRFSISWSRLIPNGRGEVNPKGLEYYNNLIDELLDHATRKIKTVEVSIRALTPEPEPDAGIERTKFGGIEPHATLFQYDIPQVLEDEYSGWLSPQIIGDFTAYADVCFKEFGDRVSHWATLNEPNAFALIGYDAGVGPPGRCSKPYGNCSDGNSAVEPYIVAHHCLLAHSSVVSLYRTKYQEKQQGHIGMDIFITEFLPYTNSAEDIAAAKRAQVFYTGWFLHPLYYGDYPTLMKKKVGSKLPKFSRGQSEQLINSLDFLGVNYYTITYAKYDPQDAPSNERDFMADASAWTNINNCTSQSYVPSYGLERVLKYLKQSYGNPPIYIHENGFPMRQDVVFDDSPRVVFLSEHIRSLLNSLRDGSNIKGYFVWSLVDLYELLGGNQNSYGLYYVDRASKDLKRYPRRSALWYKDFLKGKRDATSTRACGSSQLVSS